MNPTDIRAHRTRRFERGVTVLELLVATSVVGLVLLMIFANFFINERIYSVQSELAATQAEARRVVQYLERDLLSAGYELKFNALRLDAIHPGDPTTPEVYADNRVALRLNLFNIRTGLSANMPQPSSELKVDESDVFVIGDHAVIFDQTGAVDWFIVTQVQYSDHLQHKPPENPEDFSKAYRVEDDAEVMKIHEVRYWHDPDTLQVFRQEDHGKERILAHNITDLTFTYYDDSEPPQAFVPDTLAERQRIRKVEVEVVAQTEHEHRDIRDHRFFRLVTEVVPRNVTMLGTNPAD